MGDGKKDVFGDGGWWREKDPRRSLYKVLGGNRDLVRRKEGLVGVTVKKRQEANAKIWDTERRSEAECEKLSKQHDASDREVAEADENIDAAWSNTPWQVNRCDMDACFNSLR